MSDTKVYFIVNLKIHDSEVYRIYEKGFFPILKKYDGEFITFDDNPKHVEGHNPIEQDRMIMFPFLHLKKQMHGGLIPIIKNFLKIEEHQHLSPLQGLLVYHREANYGKIQKF